MLAAHKANLCGIGLKRPGPVRACPSHKTSGWAFEVHAGSPPGSDGVIMAGGRALLPTGHPPRARALARPASRTAARGAAATDPLTAPVIRLQSINQRRCISLLRHPDLRRAVSRSAPQADLLRGAPGAARVVKGEGWARLAPSAHLALLAPINLRTPRRPSCALSRGAAVSNWIALARAGRRTQEGEHTSRIGTPDPLRQPLTPAGAQRIWLAERFFS